MTWTTPLREDMLWINQSWMIQPEEEWEIQAPMLHEPYFIDARGSVGYW